MIDAKVAVVPQEVGQPYTLIPKRREREDRAGPDDLRPVDPRRQVARAQERTQVAPSAAQSHPVRAKETQDLPLPTSFAKSRVSSRNLDVW